MLFVVSVTVMSVNTTVIGGLQSGWNVAVTSIEKSALPFWTGTSSAPETLTLFAALGCWLPGLMHDARGGHHDVDLLLIPEPGFLAVYRQGVAGLSHAARYEVRASRPSPGCSQDTNESDAYQNRQDPSFHWSNSF